jgi:hypothetical protein
MGRQSCGYKQKLRKGLWSPDEDEKLLRYITEHGHGCWSSVPKLAGDTSCLSGRPLPANPGMLFNLLLTSFCLFSNVIMNFQVLKGAERVAG